MQGSESFEILTTKRLDHLPLVSACMRYLEIGQIIDELVDSHKLNCVSTGECLQAMVLSILTGQHALYKVSEVLGDYDTEIVFQKQIKAESFHDNRLGVALDQMWEAGLGMLYSKLIAKAIMKYSLGLEKLHFDTTSISLYGAYEQEEDGDDIPRITYGHSKDKRTDLKQVLFGMTVSGDGGVPLTGRITSGNTSDSTENRFNLETLREIVPDISRSILVSDSKFFSAPTVEMAFEQGISFISLMPKTVGMYEEILKEDKPSEILLTTPGRRKGEYEEYRGFSLIAPYVYKTDNAEQRHRQMRFVVVESTALQKQKERVWKAKKEKEYQGLTKLSQGIQKREFACEEDALREIDKLRKQIKVDYHRLGFEREKRTVIEKRQHRGRPRAGEQLPQRESWTVNLSFQEDAEHLSQSKQRLNKFILVTNILDSSRMTDAEILKAYKGQSSVETNFKWAKNPAAVAPIFLKDPKRIAVLGFVYLVALMVYTLMQRQIRQSLKRDQKSIPGNKGLTDNPTGRVLFQNMRGIAVVVVSLGESVFKQVTNFTQLHEDILNYFAFDTAIYQSLKTISSA